MLKPLNNVKNLTDPLKMFQCVWSIAFQGTLNTKMGSITHNDPGSIGQNLELRCQTYTFPQITGDTTVVNWGGFERTYAGKQTRQGEWSVDFTEVWDSSITEAFRTWFNAYHDYVNGTINLLEDYTATVTVNLLNPDTYDTGSKAHTQKKYDIVLYDVFPTNISYPQIDASSSNPITISAKFHYNYFILGDEEAKDLQKAASAGE